MAFSYSIADKTYTDASFSGNAYADEDTGFPGALRDIVLHTSSIHRQPVTGSITVGTGTKSGTTYRNMPLYVGQPVRVERASSSATYMTGTVTTYTASTGAVTFNMTATGGSGTFSDFIILPQQSATLALSGLTAATSFTSSDTVAMSVTGADRQVTGANFAASLGAMFSTTTVATGKVTVDDANFSMDIVTSNPTLTFDTNDNLIYDRTNNAVIFTSGGVERLRVDSAGRLLIGNNTAIDTEVSAIPATKLAVQIIGNSIGTAGMLLGRATGDALGPHFVISKSRGTAASPTAASNGDTIGVIDFVGFDGSNLPAEAARIIATVDGAPSTSIVPGRLSFQTASTVNASPQERMRMDSSGHVIVGTAGSIPMMIYGSDSSEAQFQVVGTTVPSASMAAIRFSADAGGAGLSLQKGRGTAASPAAVSSGDVLGMINFGGYDSAATPIEAAHIFVEADAAPGVNIIQGRLRISTHDSAGASIERFRLDSAGAAFFPGVGTTASAANAFINNASSPVNSLLRSTSSARYKDGIQDLDVEVAERFVREARPISYRSKAPADNPAWTYYGLTAEAVADIDPRLVHWTRDAEGEPLRPDGVMYDRIPVLMLPVVRRLLDRVAALEARVGA